MPTSSRTDLAGVSLVHTRPAGTAAALAHAARQRGAEVFALPGLALHASPDDEVHRAQWRAAREGEVFVYTSPAAVRFARAHPDFKSLSQRQVFAVGDGTRRALALHGMAAIAPRGRGESETLLALPELADVAGRTIVVFAAPGGRDLIAPTLRRRGAVVLPVHVYRRTPPSISASAFERVRAATLPLVMLVSSGEALSNLVSCLPADLLARLRGARLVASSERLAALAGGYGFTRVVVADGALPKAMLDAAARAVQG